MSSQTPILTQNWPVIPVMHVSGEVDVFSCPFVSVGPVDAEAAARCGGCAQSHPPQRSGGGLRDVHNGKSIITRPSSEAVEMPNGHDKC